MVNEGPTNYEFTCTVLDGLSGGGEGLGGFGRSVWRGGVGWFWMVCLEEGRGWVVLDGLSEGGDGLGGFGWSV